MKDIVIRQLSFLFVRKIYKQNGNKTTIFNEHTGFNPCFTNGRIPLLTQCTYPWVSKCTIKNIENMYLDIVCFLKLDLRYLYISYFFLLKLREKVYIDNKNWRPILYTSISLACKCYDDNCLLYTLNLTDCYFFHISRPIKKLWEKSFLDLLEYNLFISQKSFEALKTIISS